MGKTQAQTELLDAGPTLCRGQMPPPSSVPMRCPVRRLRDLQVEVQLGADRLEPRPVALPVRLGRDWSWARWWGRPRNPWSALRGLQSLANDSVALLPPFKEAVALNRDFRFDRADERPYTPDARRAHETFLVAGLFRFGTPSIAFALRDAARRRG